MKKLIFSAALVLSLTALAACGDTEETAKEDVPAEETTNETEVETEAVEEEKADDAEQEVATNEVTESELGTLTVLYKNKEVNHAFESGTVKGSINKIQLAALEVEESQRYMFDELEKVTVITAEISAENTVDETISFYPDQATIVTNTGQQIDADMLLSDNIGGDYLGVVKKSGNVIWTMPYDEGVTSVAIHISGASDTEYNRMSDDLKIELPLQ